MAPLPAMLVIQFKLANPSKEGFEIHAKKTFEIHPKKDAKIQAKKD